MLPTLMVVLGLVLTEPPGAFVLPPLPESPRAGLRVPARPHHGHGHRPVHVSRGHGHHHGGGFILPPGPGAGWGFPNNAPDGYGWYDVGPFLPLGGDRTTTYFFPRHYAVPPTTMFLPSYYNPFVTRGQRFLPYAGAGGLHPAGGPPTGPANLPVLPYDELSRSGPVRPVPDFSGEVEAPPVQPGQGEDLIP